VLDRLLEDKSLKVEAISAGAKASSFDLDAMFV
jgi:hypothetical protein